MADTGLKLTLIRLTQKTKSAGTTTPTAPTGSCRGYARRKKSRKSIAQVTNLAQATLATEPPKMTGQQ